MWFLQKSLNVANLLSNATEPWTIKISQNSKNLGFLIKKNKKVFPKTCELFLKKSLKVAKLHYNATGTAKILKTLKKLVFFEKLFGFFWRRIFFFKKPLQVSNLHSYATEILKVPKTFKLGFSQIRQMGFSKKKEIFKNHQR